jgi:hypothetical protein
MLMNNIKGSTLLPRSGLPHGSPFFHPYALWTVIIGVKFGAVLKAAAQQAQTILPKGCLWHKNFMPALNPKKEE